MRVQIGGYRCICCSFIDYASFVNNISQNPKETNRFVEPTTSAHTLTHYEYQAHTGLRASDMLGHLPGENQATSRVE